jgi:AcrR family transcriptional regulator
MVPTQVRSQARREAILQAAASVFAAHGYHRASMRDIARAAGGSLAGLYHHFATKEEILFAISTRAFDTVITGAETALQNGGSGEERLRVFVDNHLGYFAGHLTEMKVLSHESESLTGEHRREIQERKRRYVALAEHVLSGLDGVDGAPRNGARANGRDTRLSALALFGMMNWIYTWYRRGEDLDLTPAGKGGADIHRISRLMSEIFLRGYLQTSGPSANA